jgi:glycosyltransferase involved in cell wall biosynthesis
VGDRRGRLRIGYLTGQYPRATDTWIQREIAGLRRLGDEVSTFAVRRPGDEHMVGDEQRAERDSTTYLYPRLRSIRLIIAHLGLVLRSPARYVRTMRLAWTTRRPGLAGTAYQAVYFLEGGLLAASLLKRRIRHLHNHFGDSSCTVAMLASELSGVPFSFTLHGPGIFFEPYTWRLDAKLERAAFCATISWFCRSQAAIFARPDDLDRIHIVHCGVVPDALPSVRHDGPGTQLLFVARLAELKGLSVLLAAVAALADDHAGLALTVIGDGPERRRFELLAAELGVADRVDFVGYRSQAEVADHLAATDVFVLPSYAEGVPVTLMEAMGAGVPVVATQVGGVSELVEDGTNGFVVRPGDVEQLTDRLHRLLIDPGLRADFGAAGRDKVGTEFASATEAARLQALIEAAQDGRPSPIRPAPDPGPPARA